MSDTVTVNIYSQFDSSKVLFSADVDAAIEGRLHLREALVIAVGGGANLRDANLCGADLRNANLRYADLRNADLRDANLRDANLCGADLRYANLRDANLRGADLCCANLRDANLRDANLCGANLRDANLRDANLCGADLRNANLRNADLCGADLCGADLYCATIDDGSKLTGKRPIFMLGPIGSESRTFIAYITDQGLRLRAGCFFGTREEFESRLESTHGTDSHHAKEYKAALSMIDAHCDLWTPEVEA